jgi:hypothetical protein
MTEQFKTINKKQAASDKAAKQIKRISRGLIAATVVIFVLIGFSVSQIIHNRQATNQNIKIEIAACQSGNVNKAHDIALWEDILKTDHPTTAAAKDQLATIQNLVHVRDKPVNCVARYS